MSIIETVEILAHEAAAKARELYEEAIAAEEKALEIFKEALSKAQDDDEDFKDTEAVIAAPIADLETPAAAAADETGTDKPATTEPAQAAQ